MKKLAVFVSVAVVIFLSGCPNTMIGLGDKVDIDTPKVTIGTYGDGTPISNGDYVKGVITLTGSASDDIGIRSVSVSLDGGTSFKAAEVSSDGRSWSFTVDTSAYEDGEKDIIVLVSDTSETPKTNEERLLLYFDNTPPVVMVSVSPGYTSTASDSEFSIKGEASDPFRVKKVSVEIVYGSASVSDVEGTNSWSCVLSGAVTGTYKLEVSAEDFAGNVSTHFYHYTDVNALNGGDFITVENLYSIENGETVPDARITEEDLQSISLSELVLNVDMNEDVPVITISNPEPGAQLGGNAVVIGRVEDDDEVDSSSIMINIDNGGWVWDASLPATEITGSGQAVNFKYDISSLSNGSHSISVKASDTHGTEKISDPVVFTIDLGAPEISITSPEQGEYVNTSDVALAGTAYDDQSVQSVRIQIDGADESEWGDASTSNGYADWSFTAVSLSEGMHSVKVYAEDGTGKVSSYNVSFYVDVTAPEVTFRTPSAGEQVNGNVTFRGSCSDNYNAFSSGSITIGKNGSPVSLDNLDNWSYEIDSTLYTNTDAADETEPGSDIWKLPVVFSVTDIAGNVTTTQPDDYYVLINQALDKPSVTVISPSDGSVIGGSIIVSGTSIDDEEVYSVEMRLDVDGDGLYTSQVDLNRDGDTLDNFEDETQWITVSGTNPWQQELNADGELYTAGASGDGTVEIQVRAIDTKDGITPDTAGDPVSITVKFDNTVPYFDNVLPAQNTYVKGTFTLSADAYDNSRIEKLLISYDGGTSYTDITASSTKIDDTHYAVSENISSSDYISDSGILYLRLKAVDDANYQGITSVNLNVDNIYPTGSWTGELDDINGSFFKVQGEALDAGSVSGIEKIEVYFIRNGDVYSPSAYDTHVPAGSVDFGDGSGSVAYSADSDYKIVVDAVNEFGDDSSAYGDGDGYNESITLSGSTYSWWAEMDSANIPDGTVEVHFVVWDKAGNARHYEESGFIKNHKPSITSITAGTDLNWDDTVTSDEQFTYSGSFDAQNRLYLAVNADDDDAASLNYEIFYGSDASGTLISSSQSCVIDISSGYPEGAATFFCRVTDSDGITVSSAVDVVIDNEDTVVPTIHIDTLSEASVPSGHLDPGTVSSYDGDDPDVSGEVRLTGNAWDNQRIKSITITLDGTGTDYVLAAWEGNELVSKDPNFTIDSYYISQDTGILVTWTYVWDTTTVTGVAADNVQITVKAEDYASPSNSASDSMQVDVVPYISRIRTSLTDSFSDAFSRSASGKYDVMVNSSDGTFETITVYGYNLNPSATGSSSDVRLSIDPDGLDSSGNKTGEGLSYANVAADYTQVDVNLEEDGVGPASGNGFLTIITNGIPSVNNINDNTANSEADYINPNLDDDRYLAVWDLNLLRNTVDTAESAVYPSMAMDGDTPVFAYVNNAAGYGRARYWDGTTDKAIYNNWDLFTYTAVDLNSDGDHAVLYDINVVNGNYGDYNSGNYGGILTSFFYDVPDHDYYPDSLYFQDNHVWLDNLVDTSGTTTAVLDRYQYPDMVVNSGGTTSGTRVFYTVYDRMTDRILYRTFMIGTDSSIAASSGGQINDSSSQPLYTDIDQYNENGTFPTYDQSSTTDNKRFANSNTSGSSPSGEHVIDDVNTGEFTAVAATADGSTVVVVYYDNSGTGNVRLKYNNSPADDSTWTDMGIIDSGHGGEFLDMVLDSGDNIHIAYYDNNRGDLRYIYIPVNDFSTGSFGTVSNVIVDSYFDVGERLTIKLDGNDKPFIAYKGVNRSGKVAWLTGALADGADSSDQFTGTWEVMILPVTITNSDSNRFCIGVDTNGLPVVGYTNGGIEYIRLLRDLNN